MMGLGRGAGNCPTEILLGFLRNPKYKLRPVMKLLRDTILPLRKQYDWGPSVPYHITGLLDLHPRVAIACREGDAPDDYVAFYDEVVTNG